MIQQLDATVLLQSCQNIVQNSETSHSQSLCNEISAIFGGTWCTTAPPSDIFWGTCPPCPPRDLRHRIT